MKKYSWIPDDAKEFVWSEELIASVKADLARGYDILYGPNSTVWDGEKWVPRKAEAKAA